MPAGLDFADSAALFPDEPTRRALSRAYDRDILASLVTVRSALVR